MLRNVALFVGIFFLAWWLVAALAGAAVWGALVALIVAVVATWQIAIWRDEGHL